MHANDDQTAYDPGPARIHWNPARRDIRLLAGAILMAGVLIGAGMIWSADVESQAVRCASLPLAAAYGTVATLREAGQPVDPEMAAAIRSVALGRGCSDPLLLGE